MASFLDQLKAAPMTNQAIWNRFIIEYKPNGNLVYFFHEGKDDPSFYRKYVEEFLPGGYSLRFMRCGNKTSVLDRAKDFSTRFDPDSRVIFAVDKDHDDLMPINLKNIRANLYVTTAYSIENFVCNREVVEKFLVDNAGLPEIDKRVEDISNKYGEMKAELLEIALPIMAWIVCARKKGLHLNLNNFDSGKAFSIDKNLRPSIPRGNAEAYSYLSNISGFDIQTAGITDDDVAKEVILLKRKSFENWFRGKQDLWFLVNFLNAVSDTLKAEGAGRKNISLSISNALEILSPKASCPTCLKVFLKTLNLAEQ